MPRKSAARPEPKKNGARSPELLQIRKQLRAAQQELRVQHRRLSETHRSLRLSRQRYADLFRFAPVAYLTLAQSGHISEINQAGAELLGGRREGVRHALFLSFVAREDFGLFFAHVTEVQKAMGNVRTELRLQRADGATFPVQMTTALSRDESDRPCELHSTIVDLSDLKAIESELRLAREDLEARVKERTRELVRANEQLKTEIERRQSLERELLDIAERERQRLGEDLHDETCQSLAGLSYLARVVSEDLIAVNADAAEQVKRIEESLNFVVDQTRNIARGLCPVALHSGLVPALQELTHSVSQKVHCKLALRQNLSVTGAPALALYRIAQEACANAIKHAQARTIHLTLRHARDQLTMTIQDDGAGFPPKKKRTHGMGLDIMKYRAHSIGASLKIQSEPGQGTKVICEVPFLRYPETAPHILGPAEQAGYS